MAEFRAEKLVDIDVDYILGFFRGRDRRTVRNLLRKIKNNVREINDSSGRILYLDNGNTSVSSLLFLIVSVLDVDVPDALKDLFSKKEKLIDEYEFINLLKKVRYRARNLRMVIKEQGPT